MALFLAVTVSHNQPVVLFLLVFVVLFPSWAGGVCEFRPPSPSRVLR